MPFALAFAFTGCVHVVKAAPAVEGIDAKTTGRIRRNEDFDETNPLMEVEVIQSYRVIHVAVFKANPGVQPFPSASCFW